MSPSTTRALASIALATGILAAGPTGSQPPPMKAPGCCCAVQGKTYTCTEKTQADCLAEQPSAPTFPKAEDWKKAWNEWMQASEQQEAKPMHGGWIAGPCEKVAGRARPDA